MRLPSIAVLGLAACCCAFGQGYTKVAIAGGALPENGPGMFAGLENVNGVAVDEEGNVFMALPTYSIVVRMDATTGDLTLVAGNGTVGYSGDNGPATAAQLTSPYSLAFDPDGNLYIGDLVGVVREVRDGVITTVAGPGCGLSGIGDGGPATCANLSNPRGIAIDANFNLYIADTGNLRVRMVSNGIITTVAGDGNSGSNCITPSTLPCTLPNNREDGGPATSGHLYLPFGVAVDAGGDLFIADTGNGCVRIVSGGIINTFECTYTPFAIAISSAGQFYITSEGMALELVNGALTPVAGKGSPGFGGDGGPALSAQLSGGQGGTVGPLGIAVDATGAIYIADSANMRVRKVKNGIITTAAGRSGGGYLGDGGPSASSQLNTPTGVAVDSAGNLYFSDSGNHAVRKVAGGVISTVAGNGTPGFTGDGGPATSAQLNNPTGLAIDGAGNLYIVDTGNNSVRKVTNGVISTVPGTNAQLQSPSAVAADPSGNLYVVTHYSIVTEFGGFPGGFIDPTVQTTNWGQVSKISNGLITSLGSSTQITSTAGGIAVDSGGNLYISAVTALLYLAAGSILGASPPPAVPGTSSPVYTGGIFLDASGALWIADYNGIVKVSNGAFTLIANAGFPTQGIAVDNSGNVYLSDPTHNRIWALIPSE